MNQAISAVLAAGTILSACSAHAASVESAQKTAILSTMTAYESALNSSDTDAVMHLYTEDGVFMSPYSASAVGAAAVRQAYMSVFKAIKLDVKFGVAEVVEMAPGWAFVRTNSAGYTTVNASGKQGSERNQELFILHNESDRKWKIARYSFSSTNPTPGK